MKSQDLFSLKNNYKKNSNLSAVFANGALRVNIKNMKN